MLLRYPSALPLIFLESIICFPLTYLPDDLIVNKLSQINEIDIGRT